LFDNNSTFEGVRGLPADFIREDLFVMTWFKKVFRRSQSNSVLCPSNQKLMDGFRKSNGQALTVLKACRTRQQVIDGLRTVSLQGGDIAPIAARAAKELEDNFTLDAFRIRDDMVRTLEAFMSSTRNF
jgi:hypothetical protein